MSTICRPYIGYNISHDPKKNGEIGKTTWKKPYSKRDRRSKKEIKGGKDSSLRPPKDNFLHPKHRRQLKIPKRCKRFSEMFVTFSIVKM